MTAALLAGLVAGYGVAIPVGAVAVLVASLSARTTLRVGAAAALGVATADGLYALVAVLGGAALAGTLAVVAGPLRWLAGAILLLMAAHTAYAGIRRHLRPVAVGGGAGLDPTTAARAYAGLLALTLLNPMTIVYFAALVLGGSAGGPATGAAGATLFVTGVTAASASWQLLLAGGGRLVGRVLTGPGGRLGTALVSSALIAALAVALLVTAGADGR